MLFAMSATDRVDAGSLRADTRPEHLEHLKRMGAKVAFAGPYLAADGKTYSRRPIRRLQRRSPRPTLSAKPDFFRRFPSRPSGSHCKTCRLPGFKR